MSMQTAFTVPGDARRTFAMMQRPKYTDEILRDDIRWLETQIRQLQASNACRERKLAECYRKLLGQRRRQLATSGHPGGGCPGCWNDYLY